MHAGLVVVLPLLLAIQNLWSLMVPFYVFVPSHGVHQPCGQSSAVTPFPAAAGAALALNGFFNGGRGFCHGQLANAAK